MKLLVFHINPNDRSAHILKNEEMFRGMGIDVTDVYDHDLLRGDLKKSDALYLNWFENIDGGPAYMPVLRFIRRKIQLSRIRRSKIRVLFCKHNRFPHNVRYPALSRNLYLQLCRMAGVIIAFNNDADSDLKSVFPAYDFSEKIRVIPPLNYIGVYPPDPDSEIYRIAEKYRGRMIVCFIGKISSYKNVELILRAAGELKDKNMAFLIFGKPVTEEYRLRLEKMAEGLDNVTAFFDMVPDEEMQPLLDVSDILIMPYDKRSASNSGTGRLAFSYGRTVISPDISSMNLIPEELIYKYHYDSSSEHYEKMLEQLLRAYNDWQTGPGMLRSKGEQLLELMKRDYSQEVIEKKYMDIFDALI